MQGWHDIRMWPLDCLAQLSRRIMILGPMGPLIVPAASCPDLQFAMKMKREVGLTVPNNLSFLAFRSSTPGP